jgi:hypothetical protein
MQFCILSHESGQDLYDFQEGRSITEVERPQRKIEMTGMILTCLSSDGNIKKEIKRNSDTRTHNGDTAPLLKNHQNQKKKKK